MYNSPKSLRGFTLIELLAVMAIIAILGTVGIVGYQKFQISGQTSETEAKLAMLGSRAGLYETAKGDFPPDNFSAVGSTTGNDINVGIEALVAAFASKTPIMGVSAIDTKDLINSDEDTFSKAMTSYPARDAFEVKDSWGNPIIYFHRKSYGKKQTVLLKKRGDSEPRECSVDAVPDPVTKSYKGSSSCQLISAGYDGEYGTEDDIIVTP
ncbi:MAG: type II secretion system protein [Planctomycetota bacterium]